VDELEVFAANLIKRRKRARMSQEELADAADIHRTHVSLLERGRREPRLGTIVKLARALKVSPSRLLDGIE
jgi:transcriptional regulator with XRE-family HTH domain